MSPSWLPSFGKKQDFSQYGLPGVWHGKEARLVLALDIGTTQTAVSAAYLVHGKPPLVLRVSRWKGQEEKVYEEKVPTVCLYNDRGQLVACGAEAVTREMQDKAQRMGWHYAREFKLHLHPNAVLYRHDIKLKPLPPTVPLDCIYTDFLRYVLRHTQSFLKDSAGADLWFTMSPRVEVIVAHPNKWAMNEQAFLHKAVVDAGLISESRSKTALHFVEEAEASARYCVSTNSNAFAMATLKAGIQFMVCDAGGSTVDISCYEVKEMSSKRMQLNELELPTCVAAGGSRIDEALAAHLLSAFKTISSNDEVIDGMAYDGVKDFQEHAKRRHTLRSDTCTLSVGDRRLNEEEVGIERGSMTIPASTANSFFSKYVERILASIQTQMTANPTIKYVILTGGFGESPYLKREIEERFSTRAGIVVANSSNSKAVAVGALMLVIGAGSVVVERKERPYKTWATNFLNLGKVLVGLGEIVTAIVLGSSGSRI